MFISNFIKALLPVFEKDRLISDIRVTRGELTELQDAYSTASKLLKSWKFQNSDVSSTMSDFRRNMSTSENAISYIDSHLDGILKNLQQLEDLAVQTLGNSISGNGLTYKQAAIVKYCDAMFLVAKYARKFLNWVYVMETSNFSSEKSVTDSISKYELKWINDTFVDFCNALKSTTLSTEKMMSGFSDIPEIQVTASDSDSLRNTIGDAKLDPFKLGFIATKANPIYYIRMLVAEYQVRRYKEMKEELSLLQLRRMNLEKYKANKPDANLERQIEYVESRAQKLSFEISEMESGK